MAPETNHRRCNVDESPTHTATVVYERASLAKAAASVIVVVPEYLPKP